MGISVKPARRPVRSDGDDAVTPAPAVVELSGRRIFESMRAELVPLDFGARLELGELVTDETTDWNRAPAWARDLFDRLARRLR